MKSVRGGGRRIGIFGGSFNPVHNGHLILAQDALESFGLETVLFVPAALPPHKASQSLASPDDRLHMLRLAVEGDARFDVSDHEVLRGGVSYSVDTVQDLRERHPDAELFFIIGTDTLRELRSWKDVGRLLNLCEFVTVARPGVAADAVREDQIGLPEPWPARLCRNIVSGHLVEISSTDIRNRVARGRSIRYLVPGAVERYIAAQNLYRTAETKP
jgi:nicotinate-nucleotide adenylyltransferase